MCKIICTLKLLTLLATSLSVLREWPDEPLRAAWLSARYRHSMGRAGIHCGDRAGGVSRRDLARPVCAAHSAAVVADFARSLAFAGICRAHDLPHVRGACVVAAFHADLRHLGGEERTRRQIAGAHSGYPAIGADFGFHFHYS